MKLNKKVIESMTVATSLAVMTAFTGFAGSTPDGTRNVTEIAALSDINGTAGIIDTIYRLEQDAVTNTEYIQISLEKTQKDIVAEGNGESEETAAQESGAAVTDPAAETDAQPIESDSTEAATDTADGQDEVQQADAAGETEAADAAEETVADAAEGTAVDAAQTEQPELTADAEQPSADAAADTTNDEWANRVMANVEEDMNIRTAPDETSELAGKFYRGDVAEVVSVEGDWTQVTSGNVTGYVKNDYLVYGQDAANLASEVCSEYATVNADGLRLRSEPGEDASVVTTAASGDRLKVNKDAETADGWVAVETSDGTAYVSADYVSVALNLGTALNSEEVAAKEKAKEEAEAKEEAKKEAKKNAVSANADEVTLLGALIQCEAGNGSYEGMVAVGAVVMNRVRSGGYPSTITGVIYQSGQFTPALSGSVANVAAGGVKSSCLQAAKEALAGTDNTGGALSFRSASSGYSGTVIGANVFF